MASAGMNNTAMDSMGGAMTYEDFVASESTTNYPDKINWERNISYRSNPYRQLHHQKGLIGTFTVRLLEAKELTRSYWSALAIGPMKHLGLSTAHGPISSYVSLHLDYQSVYKAGDSYDSDDLLLGRNNNSANGDDENLDQKLPAKPSPRKSPRKTKNRYYDDDDEEEDNIKSKSADHRNVNKDVQVSPVIPGNDNPVWTDTKFDLPLTKGSLTEDGQRILLKLRVDEDSTAVENFVPGIPSYGDDSRCIGHGYVDITSLCLGMKLAGQNQSGVIDTWVSVYHRNNDHDHEDDHHDNIQNQADQSDNSMYASKDNLEDLKKPSAKTKVTRDGNRTGQVRILVSYRPNGLTPQENDIVAMEAFARRPNGVSSCNPIMSPLAPLVILEQRGPYYKVQYTLLSSSTNSAASASLNNNDNNSRNRNNNNSSPTNRQRHIKQQKACMRIHRNSIFVIERTNLLDTTKNIAMIPADIVMSTNIGRNTVRAINPAINAGKDLMMPAILSTKLLWMGVRTTASAGIAGVKATSNILLNDGIIQPLTQQPDQHHHHLNHDK